jgi:hypothetical protein
MKQLILNSHLLISVVFTLFAYAVGFSPIAGALIISAYWAGREIAQAEERFLSKYRLTRDEMPLLTAYYNPKAWNIKSFWGDMVIPFIMSLLLALYLQEL